MKHEKRGLPKYFIFFFFPVLTYCISKRSPSILRGKQQWRTGRFPTSGYNEKQQIEEKKNKQKQQQARIDRLDLVRNTN